MKLIYNITAYSICLQLVFGNYPIQLSQAWAQEYNQEESAGGRSPASEKLNMSAQEVAENSINYVNNFQQQCVDKDGTIRENVAFVHDKEIGNSEPRMYNCAAAAEVIQKVIIPGMNDVIEESAKASQDPNCPDCSVASQNQNATADVQTTAACSVGEQQKFANEKCSFDCNILATVNMQDSSCPKSSGVSASCFKELGKGIAKAVLEIITFLPKLIYEGVKGGWNYLMGKTESASSKKAHALKGLSDKEIKEGQKNPEKLKRTLLQKVGNFMKELSLAIIGYPEYEAKSKCVNCKGKADLMCGVIGNTAGFLISIFGNGLVFGATKGVATRIGLKLLRASRGTSKLAKFTSTTAKVMLKPGKYISKPFIAMGNLIVKGGSKVSRTVSNSWQKFKKSKLFEKIASFKNTGLYKKAFSGNNKVIKNAKDFANKTGETIKKGGKAVYQSQLVQIPKNITLKVGRGIGKGFKKMGEFEDRMFIKGIGLTNKSLQGTYLRAQKINMLRNLKTADSVVDVATTTSAATDEALRGVDELKVVRDAADGRTVEQWSEIKKTAVDKLNIKNGHLDDVENVQLAEFSTDAANTKSLMIDTPSGPREINVPNSGDVEKIHLYQDGKMAIIKNKDGGYLIHNIDDGKTVAKVSESKSEYVDALLGKKTKQLDDLETTSYNQVKTNLEINGTKYDEVVDAGGNKSLKVDTPEGCSPSSLSVGVEKAL